MTVPLKRNPALTSSASCHSSSPFMPGKTHPFKSTLSYWSKAHHHEQLKLLMSMYRSSVTHPISTFHMFPVSDLPPSDFSSFLSSNKLLSRLLFLLSPSSAGASLYTPYSAAGRRFVFVLHLVTIHDAVKKDVWLTDIVQAMV
jgi:hypothetical protein